MNNNRKHYIKKEQKGQIIFVLAILLAVIIGLGWVLIEDANDHDKYSYQLGADISPRRMEQCRDLINTNPVRTARTGRT